jgi:hypothetical protein
MNFQPFGHWKEYAPLTFRTVAGQVMIVPAVASGVGEGDGLDDAFGAVLTDDGDVEGPLAVRPGAAQAADRLTRTTNTAMRMTMKRQVSGLVSELTPKRVREPLEPGGRVVYNLSICSNHTLKRSRGPKP